MTPEYRSASCFAFSRDIYLDINGIDNDALDPIILHNPRDLLGTLMTDQGADEVQAGINPADRATTSNNPHAAQLHALATHEVRLAEITFSPGQTALPRITALAALLEHVRIVVEVVAQIEARVVDHISLFHDVRALPTIVRRGVLTFFL